MKEADAEVLFELTSKTMGGEIKHIFSGYRPHYNVKPDYWTTVHHKFLDVEQASTGEQVKAEVWFITPEAYPNSLWVGRTLMVNEGARNVGRATISRIMNPLLLSAEEKNDTELDIV